MKQLSDRQKVDIALAYVTGRKTITQLMRRVYGAENRPHIYAIIAHGMKKYWQDQKGA